MDHVTVYFCFRPVTFLCNIFRNSLTWFPGILPAYYPSSTEHIPSPISPLCSHLCSSRSPNLSRIHPILFSILSRFHPILFSILSCSPSHPVSTMSHPFLYLNPSPLSPWHRNPGCKDSRLRSSGVYWRSTGSRVYHRKWNHGRISVQRMRDSWHLMAYFALVATPNEAYQNHNGVASDVISRF